MKTKQATINSKGFCLFPEGIHGGLAKIGRQVDDLHDWHDETDADGVKFWYVRRSLEDALHSLSENISLETKLLDRIDRRLERIEQKVENK